MLNQMRINKPEFCDIALLQTQRPGFWTVYGDSIYNLAHYDGHRSKSISSQFNSRDAQRPVCPGQYGGNIADLQ